MADRPLIKLGSPLPMTPPKKRPSDYDDILAKFGPRSSADSAAKLRRASSQQQVSRQAETATKPADNKRSTSATSTSAHSATPEPVSDGRQQRPTRRSTASKGASEANSETPAREGPSDASEDELAQPARNQRGSARIHAKVEELKMEKSRRQREKEGSLRRGTRDRKTRILESDMMGSPPPAKRRAPPKMDTARNRLREDIAKQSKARSNNFLVANKDYFLPLLPTSNQITKLVNSHDAKPIIEYEELVEQPKGVTATMKPYQLSGLSYLVHLFNNGFSGILGDEMGLGKTLQTLSLFQYLEELDRKQGIQSEENRPYLVICPLSVLNSWITEAQKWVPELKVLRFHGASADRARLKRVALGLEDMRGHETSRSKNRKASRKAGFKVARMPTEFESGSYKIIVTTYDTFAAEQSWFKSSFVWRYCVLDEGHKIKSSATQISSSLRNISAEHKLILTGTPLQNNLTEMWALLTWLYPDVFIENTEQLFKDSFDLAKGKVNRQTMDDARRLLELIMLRRMKDTPSVNLGLPPKEEVLLYVPLTPMQRFWYTRLLTRVDNAMLTDLFEDGKSKEKSTIHQDKQEEGQMQEQLQKLQKSAQGADKEWEETTAIMQQGIAKEQAGSESKSAWQKLMNLVMQLRKCCSHPYLLPDVAPDPYYLSDHIIRASGKFIMLEKLLKHTVIGQGKKVLIFSGFTRTLDYTEDVLSLVSNHNQHFKFLRLDGSTARAKRNLDIRLFNQEGSDYKVMLLSTRAGGLGINLTSAQDVIFLDEDWNPQITLQAEARAHRIGQTKPVTIYKLCTQGTVEEQMMGRIRKKLYLSTKITESMRNIHSEASVTKKERAGGRPSLADDMPQMDAGQLKTLIRRGAQALSHPDIDATEMVSWDIETMLEKCRDKPADIAAEAVHSEADEEKWLSAMERVECAVFDGKRYQRTLEAKAGASADILPDSVTRKDRRIGKNTTIMVDGFAISKESMTCGDWEAVPTFAGKDPRLADPKREKRAEINHENHCLACFEEVGADAIDCRSCPRTYHYECLEPKYKGKVSGFTGFFCSQHACADCGKNTTDAGGLIYRCRWCPQGFCEDCLDWDKAELVGMTVPEFEILGEEPKMCFYVKCPTCVIMAEDHVEQKEWIEKREELVAEEYEDWKVLREKERVEMEEREKEALKQTALRKAMPIIDVEDDAVSPPALTDTSLATPALTGSRVSTPKYMEPPQSKGTKRLSEGGEISGETRMEKKARLDAKEWSLGADPLMQAFK